MGCVKSVLNKINDNPLLLVAISALGFSTQSLLVKFLSISNFPSFEIIVARGFGQFCGVSSVLLWQSTPFRDWLGTNGTQRSILFSRGFFGFLGMAFFFMALRKTTLANVQVAQQTVTVWTAILSRIFLGEPWFVPEMITTVFAAAGVCLIFKPAFLFGQEEGDDSLGSDASSQSATGPLSQDSVGVVFALIGSFASAVAYVLIRTLGTTVKVPWPTVMLAQALSQMLYSVPGLYIVQQQWQVPNLNQAGYLLGCAFLGFSAQVCMTVGMQKSSSASASLVRQTGIVYSFIFEVIAIPNESLSLSTIIGAIVIVVPITLLGYYRSTQKKEEAVIEGKEVELVRSEESDGGDSQAIVESSVKTPLANSEASDGRDGVSDEDEDSDGTSLYKEAPHKRMSKLASIVTSKPNHKSSPVSSGKYSTISRVGSDDDLENDEIGEEVETSGFGFRWGGENETEGRGGASHGQSWQSLTSHNWTEGEEGGWDSWGQGGGALDDSPDVLSSMKSSLRSTTHSVLQLPSVFKTSLGKGTHQPYRGIDHGAADDFTGNGKSNHLSPLSSSSTALDDDDDDDEDFGV